MRTLILAVMLFVLSFPASGQMICGPYQAVVDNLRNRYLELSIHTGIGTGGSYVMQMFTALSGSWTIIAVRPNGEACFMAAGTSLETATPDYTSIEMMDRVPL